MRTNTGTRFERDVRDYYKKRDFQVMRSAGSFGAADLLAWNLEEVHLIQCKKEKKERKYDADIEELKKLPAPKSWIKSLWIKQGKFIKIIDISTRSTSVSSYMSREEFYYDKYK